MSFSRSSPSPRYIELQAMYRQMHQKGEEFLGVPAEKTFPGFSLDAQLSRIKALITRTGADTLLDYGCGKGHQYSKTHEWEPGVVSTLDQYLGVDNVYKFDPAWKEFETPPPMDKKFDAIILIQCIGFIPDNDIPVLKQMLMQQTSKFCFIGEAYSTYGNVKSKKPRGKLENFSATRSPEWFAEQFKDWSGSELVFEYT
jgi:hypothetical protein